MKQAETKLALHEVPGGDVRQNRLGTSATLELNGWVVVQWMNR